MKHVVIAGGGFAGVRLARKLRKNNLVRVTLINDSNDFRYSPALYRAATGFKMGTARLPLEWMLLDSSNVSLLTGVVTTIQPETKSVILQDGRAIAYDCVVFCLGAVTTYFDIDGLHEHSYGVKSFDEIASLKHHIHESLVDRPKQEQNFVVVGAGPTGVELSGALGAYLRQVAKRHKIKHPSVKVYLVEAGSRILPQMSPRAARKVERKLRQLGIQILTDMRVLSETAHSLKTSDGMIKTDTVIWTAGTANNPFFKAHPAVFDLDKRGKVVVNSHLQISESIYVCGDNAATPYSGLALSAINHANFVAKDIAARTFHRTRKKYTDKHPIQVVPVSGRWAVLQYRSLVMGGFWVSLVRRAADIVGYTDILGLMKAITIWKESDRQEEQCTQCHR